MQWQYNEERTRIVIEPPKRTKKITGHRFPSILQQNKYQTPFGAWCEITGLATLPFEDNKFTLAGKAIEPKQIEYAKSKFPNVKSTEEYYGNNFAEYRYSNFKDLGRIFDGVRDFVSTKNDGVTITMVGECKTSSKPQDWANNNVPIDYLCQGMLYAYLDKLDRILYVASFLQPMDYNNPELYEVTDSNTKLTVKKLNECFIELPHEHPTVTTSGDWTTCDIRYGGIEDAIEYCEEWWKVHVEGGISPEFDEVKDKEYLDIIRKSKPTNDALLDEVCDEAVKLAREIKDLKISSGLDAKEKELKVLETSIKEVMMGSDLDNCGAYTLTRKEDLKFNEAKLYNSYCDTKVSYTLKKNLKED